MPSVIKEEEAVVAAVLVSSPEMMEYS
jgi:hypothetical protein